jgi:hypothetical protein
MSLLQGQDGQRGGKLQPHPSALFFSGKKLTQVASLLSIACYNLSKQALQLLSASLDSMESLCAQEKVPV